MPGAPRRLRPHLRPFRRSPRRHQAYRRITWQGRKGILTYGAIVIGPGGLVPVSLNVTVNGSLFSMAGPPFGSFSHDVLKVNFQTIVDVLSEQGANVGAFQKTIAVTVDANYQFGIEMQVNTLTQASGVSASAFLDPYLFLDPELIAAGYSIETSPGFGNTLPSNVPLAPAFPLFLSGVALLGRTRRRKGSF